MEYITAISIKKSTLTESYHIKVYNTSQNPFLFQPQ